ncbi:MAG: hypothetical protein WDZ49_03020 [Litorilinea sp.]
MTGELCNDHRQAVADLRVVAAFYDAQGAIVNVFVGTVADSQLEPDATTTYAIQAHFVGEASYHSYLVQTQGVLAR